MVCQKPKVGILGFSLGCEDILEAEETVVKIMIFYVVVSYFALPKKQDIAPDVEVGLPTLTLQWDPLIKSKESSYVSLR